MADTNIVAGPIEVWITGRAGISFFPPAPIDEQKNLFFRADPIEVWVTVEGEQLHQWIEAGSIDVAVTVEGGSILIGTVIDAGPIEVTVTIAEADFVLTPLCNLVRWSKIGELNFTVDQSNLANQRPMDWKGCIYNIMKLVDRAVAYGANGVTYLKPSGVHYGMQTIHRIGVKNKNAVAGNDFIHFFVDKQNRLYELTLEGLNKRDYSEFISRMGSPVLSLDEEKKMVYICDGTYGYVYSIETESFGEGPIDVTGFGVRDNVPYIVSSGDAETPKFEILTDIFDMGTRKSKTIYSLELGTDLTEYLETRIEYRVDNDKDFQRGPWKPVNRDGFSFNRCFGVEFRFRVRAALYEYLELDYLKINGVLNDYSSMDSYTLRR